MRSPSAQTSPSTLQAVRPARGACSRFRALLFRALVLASALAIGACAPAPLDENTPLETVDVDRGPTAGFSPDEDAVERRTAERVTGALPGNFPSDLPIFEPSNVVDFGPVGDSRTFVVLHTDRAAGQVTETLRSALDRSNWQRDGNALRRRKGKLVAIYRISASGKGAEIRIEYGLA